MLISTRCIATVATSLVAACVSGSALAQAGDGDIVIWGVWNCTGSQQPPAPAPARPAGTRYLDVAVAYGLFGDMYAAVRSDGVAVRWGGNAYSIPTAPSGSGYTHVAASSDGFLLTRTDGVVVVVSQLQWSTVGPPQGDRFVDVAGGYWGHSAALTATGSIVCWGNNDYGQCNVPQLSQGLRYVSVCAGNRHSGAILSDGSVRIWGNAPWSAQPPVLGSGETWRTLGMRFGSEFTGTTSLGTVHFWGGCQSLFCGSSAASGSARFVSSVAGTSILSASRSDGYVYCQDSSGAFNLCLVPALAPGHFITEMESNNCTAAGIVVRDCNLNGVPDVMELASGGADANHDGTLDQCQCIADVFVDHIVDGVDLGLVLNRWGPVAVGASGDINRDGLVDGNDMAILLNNWGPCAN